MTREEAIEILKNSTMKDTLSEQWKEAYKMAIKALENHDTFMKYSYSLGKHDALSQEPSTDAVSREAVIAIIDKVSDSAWDVNDFAYDVKEYIHQLPSVTQKSGKWIEKDHEAFKYYCDKCGTGSDLRTNYCPNCGAELRGAE